MLKQFALANPIRLLSLAHIPGLGNETARGTPRPGNCGVGAREL